MISLTDELQKFERMVYNKDLDEFISIDDQFMGNGITIQSMVKQNGFIINQMKNLKDVCLNFCKLNEKVYKKIQQHQYNIYAQNTKLNQIVGSVDRKTIQVVRDMRNLYQGTVTQNQKSKQVLQKLSSNMNQELKKKVDSTTFTKHIRAIMEDDFEQLEASFGVDNSCNTIGEYNDCNTNTVGFPILKKKKMKGASFEELQKFKNSMIPKIQQIQQQQIKTIKRFEEHELNFYNSKVDIYKINKEIEQNKNELKRIEILQDEQNIKIQQNNKKFMIELNQKINPLIWQNKFQEFHQQKIKYNFIKINQIIQQNHIEFQKSIDSYSKYFKKINQSIQQIQYKIPKLENQLPKIYQLIADNNQKVIDIQEKNILQLQKIEQKIQNYQNQLKIQISKNNQQTKQIFNPLNNKIDNLVINIEDNILKEISKINKKQMNNIDLQLKQLSIKQKQIENKFNINLRQIHNIKDILSKKANFTDLLLHVDKKADRHDIRQIKQKIENPIQYNSKKTINLDQINFKVISQKSKKKYNNFSKTLMTSFGKPTQDTPSTKIFMCGLDDHTPQMKNKQRQCFSSNNRRKSMKSMGYSAILGS